ncbi:hypothetical protein HNP55_000303 [Paucibacter oligotrophus]|uniref:Oxidoreductase molybdopterin-binding domain-containing protein n=1 Tax=Roseateles oligotrophus TaxID=1769250 RepID=A0A840L6G8_9BURK|nr:molybdopterin-dependent oxidoreductase [Roseateles oligotrophus]MBB4841808.1 hypothetical protein [Roseateles oligotrophus]
MPRPLAGLRALAWSGLLVGAALLAPRVQAQPGAVPGAAGASPAQAVATRPVVLSIAGRLLKNGQPGAPALLSLEQLAALPQHSFTTQTPWYPKPRKFTGPLLRDVLAAVGAQGETVEALALNDYKVDIPMQDIVRHPVLLARLMDDQPMPVRDKGPLFVLYPFDADPSFRSALYYSRSIWQLKALTVK